MKATGAGLAGAGVASVAGSASGQVATIAPLTRHKNKIVDPQGEEVKLQGVNICDPGEGTRSWRNMGPLEVVDLATTHPDHNNAMIRVPMQSEFIATGTTAGSGPDPMDLPHGDDWGPAMPGTYDEQTLRDYCSAVIDPIVERGRENGAYIMLDYHKHYPIFHHEQHTEYVDAGVPEEVADEVCYDSLTQVWNCNNSSQVDHTVIDGNDTNYPCRPTKGRNGNTCGERGILWHGADQKQEMLDLAEQQNFAQNFEKIEGQDDIWTEPDALCHALDAEQNMFWKVLGELYGDEEHVIFDIWNEPTGPFAGDWGSPERIAGSLSQAPVAQENAHKYQLWGEYMKPWYDMWVDRSQPWVDTAKDNSQGNLFTIGNPRWSQTVYWAPYNEHEYENMCYTGHVYTQKNSRPLEKCYGAPSLVVPEFFSEFGWMDFVLTVPHPWMDGHADEWAIGDENGQDPTGGLAFGPFFDEYPVHPMGWCFDHTWEPIFFEHGCPGTSSGAKGDNDTWEGFLITDGSTPGGWWQEWSNNNVPEISSGSSKYADAVTKRNNLDGTESGGYAFPTGEQPMPNEVPSLEDLYGTGGGNCEESMDVNGKTVCNVDDDQYYEDFNADGEMTHADVQEFFSVQHRPDWKQPEYFDFNGNQMVGHGDVVQLFEDIAAKSLP